MKVTKYNPTPLEKIRSFGYSLKIRKKLEKELSRKATEEEKKKARESWEEIKRIYE